VLIGQETGARYLALKRRERRERRPIHHFRSRLGEATILDRRFWNPFTTVKGLPMTPTEITTQLSANAGVFRALFSQVEPDMICWKPAPEHWSLLEIACHLADEEREDFRARVESVLRDPEQPLPPSDPKGWVRDRDYAGQEFLAKVDEFLEERAQSIEWLRSLEVEGGAKSPDWANAYQHPKFGPLSAKLFLENWLAHDYLHIRQINRRKYEFHRSVVVHALDYAGDW